MLVSEQNTRVHDLIKGGRTRGEEQVGEGLFHPGLHGKWQVMGTRALEVRFISG
jgi:hypothetical protein